MGEPLLPADELEERKSLRHEFKELVRKVFGL